MIGKSPKNLAVLVGINAYGNGIPSLKTPVNDTVALGEVLKNSYNYDVKLLLDSEATLAGINRLLDNLKEGILTLWDHRVVKVKSYQRFLFYFAGHGITEDAFENQDGLRGYLIPQDGEKIDKSTFLSMKQLSDVLVELKCGHLLVILDCCFAGAFPSARNVAPPEKLYREQYDRFMKSKAQQMIASAAYDEQALDVLTRLGQREDNNNRKHSPFAQALLQGLQVNKMSNGKVEVKADSIPDGVITAYELISYIDYELAKKTDKQTPGLFTLKHHHKGQYVFPIPGFKPDQLEKAPPLDKSTNPYRGLQPYDKKDSKLFFGREQVIRNLVNHVSDATKPPLTVVLGVSGSGKSSLVKAGLIPRLLKEKKEHWQILEPKRPQALVNTLFLGSETKATDNQQQISKHSPLTPQTLIEKLGADNYNTSKKLLLVIDQFEELVTQCSQEEKKQLLDALKQLLSNYSDQVQVVITLRSEFEPQLASDFLSIRKEVVLFAIILMIIKKLYKFIPILSQIYQNYLAQKQWMAARFLVPTMTQDEFREVIEKPALESVLYFEPPELVDKLINEVLGMPGALPLLSFTLSQLYLKYLERRSDNRAMTQEDYNQLGGVMGALKTSTTQVYEQLVTEDKSYEQTIRHVMLRMVAVGGGEVARRAVPASELKYRDPDENKRVKNVIDCFLEKRLLVSGTDAQGNVYYEPAHDAFILGWGQLLAWKREEQENLLLQRRLTPAAMEWKTIEQSSNKAEPLLNLWNKGLDLTYNSFHFLKTQITRLVRWNSQTPKIDKQSRFLWDSNPRLNLLEEVLNSSDSWLSETEADFVESSIKQSRRNTAFVSGAVTGVILAIGGLTIFAFNQIKNSQTNLSESYVNKSQTQLENYRHNYAVLMAAEALKTNKNFEAQKILLENQTYGLFEKLYGHKGQVSSIDFSPDGSVIASGGEDGKIIIWDIVSGTEKVSSSERVCDPEQKSSSDTYSDIEYVKFSPDGNLLAISCLNGTVSLWEIPSLTKRWELNNWHELQDNINFIPIDFTADSSNLVVGLDDGSIRFVNVDSGTEEFLKRINTERVDNLVVARDRPLLIYASYDKITLWDTQKNEKIKSWQPSRTQESSGPKISNIAFDANQELIATGTDSNLIIWLWNTKGELVRTLALPFEEPPYDSKSEIAFGKDGLTISASNPDGSLVIWNVQDGSLIQRIPASQNKVSALALSPDGTIAGTGEGCTTSEPCSIRLWDLTSSHQRAILTHKHPYDQKRLAVETIDTNPNKQELASGTASGKVYIWDIENQQIIKKINVVGRVEWVGYTEDGKFLVSLSGYSAKVWDANSYELIDEYDLNESLNWAPYPFDWGAIDNSSNLLATTSYNAFQLWKLELNDFPVKNDTLLRNVESDSDSYEKITFSPDRKHLVMKVSRPSQPDQILMQNVDNLINNMDSKNSQFFLKEHGDQVRDFAFSPEGLFAISNDSIFIWSYPKFRKLGKIDKSVNHLAFSPNGEWLAATDIDNIYLWRVSDRKRIAVFPTRHPVLINELVSHQTQTLTFSKDGKRLFSAGLDGTVQMWNLSSLLLDVETIADRNHILTGWKVKKGGIVPLDNWHERAESSPFFQRFRKSIYSRIQSFSEDWKKSHESEN
ncbi:MAG: AAA family ATPase [Moorea sp. SIO3H5]|nr:AAA family ATPase [Moorena sp. SIO3H5]